MSQGKKTLPENVYKVMLSYAVTHNYCETGRELDMPESTVRKIVGDNRDNPIFAKLCEEKQQDFIKNAERIINKAMERLEKEIDKEDSNIPVSNLSTVIGTLYDKRALAKGDPTSNESVTIKVELTDE